MRRIDAAAWGSVELAAWCNNLAVALDDLEAAHGFGKMHEVLNRAGVAITIAESDRTDRFITVRDPLAAQGERQMVARVYFDPSRLEVFVMDNTVDTDRDWLNLTEAAGPWWDMLAEFDPVTVIAAAEAAEEAEKLEQEAAKETKRLARIARIAKQYSDKTDNPGGGTRGNPTP